MTKEELIAAAKAFVTANEETSLLVAVLTSESDHISVNTSFAFCSLPDMVTMVYDVLQQCGGYCKSVGREEAGMNFIAMAKLCDTVFAGVRHEDEKKTEEPLN